LIDGKGQGHLSEEYVIKARGIMAESGVVSLIFKIDTKSRENLSEIFKLNQDDLSIHPK
jgi:mRNA degradation ribonuclease J1/J2